MRSRYGVVVRTIVEAIGCRCRSGTLSREVHLTDDGYLMDNPDWQCDSCRRRVSETEPERLAPWPPAPRRPEPDGGQAPAPDQERELVGSETTAQ